MKYHDASTSHTGSPRPTSPHVSSLSSAGQSSSKLGRRRSRLLGELKSHRRKETAHTPQDLSIAKLRYGAVPLCGREKQVEQMLTCLGHLIDKKSKRELLLIAGLSGTGKSRLADSLLDDARSADGTVALGKCNLYRCDEPFPGIVDALDGLCSQILDLKKSNLNQFIETRRCIIDRLGSEIHLLADILPKLAEILDFTGDIPQAVEQADTLDARNKQLNHTFRQFLRAICASSPPVVIVIDDIQWASDQSLELLNLLVTDRDNQNLMVIGCYRSDEVRHESTLEKTLNELKEKDSQDDFHVTEIFLENLSVDMTHEIVMALLQMDDREKTRGLAELCYKRTHGNAFFSVAFLTMLHDEGLLEFNLGSFRWTWDEATIEEKTAATANVVGLVTQRMKKMTDEVVCLLKLASCLGTTFSDQLVRVAWREHDASREYGDVDLDEMLELVVEESFLEKLSDGCYRWVHDKVQEVAISLIDSDKLASFQHQLGTLLILNLELDEVSRSIFLITNLFNKKYENGEIPSKGDEEGAWLNLRAADKAKQGSAFASVAKYAGSGIRLLPADKWTGSTDTFKLTLNLYSIGAESEGFLGNIDLMQEYCDEILGQTRCSVFDKLRAYNVMTESKANSGRTKEAIDLCIDVLGQLGCDFPKGSGGRSWKAVTTLFTLKGKGAIPSLDEVKHMSRMMDRSRIESMRLMQRLGLYCFQSADSLTMILAITRQAKWTMEYGMDTWSPVSFIGYGMLLIAVYGDFDAANKCAEVAMAMLSRLDNKSVEANTMRGAHFLILPWKHPIQNALKHLEQGFDLAMEAGDTECACQNLSTFLVTLFVAGRTLAVVDESCRYYIPILQEMRAVELTIMLRLLWQVVLNLQGNTHTAILLVGEAADETKVFQRLSSRDGSAFLSNSLKAHKAMLYAYLGEHDIGAESAVRRGDEYLKAFPGALSGMWDVFCRAVALYAAARKTRKRKYRRGAALARKKIESWYNVGNPNVHHHLSILNAEQAVLDGDVARARKLYGEGVTLAARRGFMHDAALANERFAESVIDHDKDEAIHRIREAIRFYSAWGAEHKVRMLRTTYNDLLRSGS